MPETVARAATVRPNSVDREARTFEAVIATRTPVRGRSGAMEILDVSAIRTPESVPLQLDHRTDVRSAVGRIGSFRVEGDVLVGTARLSRAADVDPILDRLADGTIDAVSVGLVVDRWAESAAGGQRSRTATDSRLREVSLTNFPLDPNARIRAMPEQVTTDPPAPESVTRAQRFRNMQRRLGLPVEFADEAIDGGWSDEDFNARALEQVERRSPATIRAAHNDTTMDNPAVYRSAVVGSILIRMGGEATEGPARELAALGWGELHKQHLRRSGQSVAGLSDSEAIERALATTDMPIIAGETVNLSIRRQYEALQSPLATLFAPRTVDRFQAHTEALTDWTSLATGVVNQLGEYKYSYVSESGESYELSTIGGITALARQLWINGAGPVQNMSQAQGRRLAADVNDRRVAFLEGTAGAGPVMKDTNAFFHASRGNIEELDTTSVETVITDALAARSKMPQRKGAGDVMIGASPSVWVVHSDFEPTALRALASIAASDVAKVNPLAGKLSLVVEPRLSDPARSYLAAAPAALDGFVQVGLSGQPGPVTESRWGFTVDAIEFKIRLDIGFGAVEWRSWTRLDHGAE